MMSSIDELSQRYGIVASYPGGDGQPVLVSEETRRCFVAALGGGDLDYEAGVIGQTRNEPPDRPRTAPECYFPDWLRERKAWGLAAQLYELRSARNWGIGDFEDLGRLCEIVADAGAQFVGLNPLHALFLAEPDRCSPFSPSDRRFLNPLYIAVDRVAGFDGAMAGEAELERLRTQELVDYDGVAKAKLEALLWIWRSRPDASADAFLTFKAEGGDPLRRHALFEALSLHMKAAGYGAGWKSWPDGFHRFDDPDVMAFGETHAERIDFHIWLQWIARDQLARAAARAKAAGMQIGLYLDFAVGEAQDGSATWSDPLLAVHGIQIGAPPDVFSAGGQDWGLSPLSPLKLAEHDFAAYRALIRSVMDQAGAMRLDHAMSLMQLFWIPQGRSAAEGGFVRYPTEGLLNVLAFTSQENRTMIIGEDLGHVPDGFRALMAKTQISSYRILYFEKAGPRFRPARMWPALALACLSTHDLATLKGWWSGSDVSLRLQHRLIDATAAKQQTRQRLSERKTLLRTFLENALLARADYHRLKQAARPDESSFVALAVAAHRFIARTPCRLASMRLADAVGEQEPTNLPGTSKEYPNWRRKLNVDIEELASLSLYRAITAAFAKERA